MRSGFFGRRLVFKVSPDGGSCWEDGLEGASREEIQRLVSSGQTDQYVQAVTVTASADGESRRPLGSVHYDLIHRLWTAIVGQWN